MRTASAITTRIITASLPTVQRRLGGGSWWVPGVGTFVVSQVKSVVDEGDNVACYLDGLVMRTDAAS